MTASDAPRPRFALVFVASPDPDGRPVEQRLRALLKYARNACRLRCVRAEEVKEVPPMSPDPEAAVPALMPPDEFRALVEKLRAAQRRPSVRRTFYSTVDKDALLSLEDAVDRELARRAGGEVTT